MLRLAEGLLERDVAVDFVVGRAEGELLREVPPSARVIELRKVPVWRGLAQGLLIEPGIRKLSLRLRRKLSEEAGAAAAALGRLSPHQRAGCGSGRRAEVQHHGELGPTACRQEHSGGDQRAHPGLASRQLRRSLGRAAPARPAAACLSGCRCDRRGVRWRRRRPRGACRHPARAHRHGVQSGGRAGSPRQGAAAAGPSLVRARRAAGDSRGRPARSAEGFHHPDPGVRPGPEGSRPA